MILAIISAIFCIAVAVLMFMPFMRQFKFYQPLAAFFMFEGIMVLFDYIYKQISPFGTVSMYIRFSGYIVCCIYFIVKFLLCSLSKGRTDK